MRQAILAGIGAVLDGLDVAFCAFDGHDRALAWNRTFLKFFPEHEGFVHPGEHYAQNLRRFYAVRLEAEELPRLESYVAQGVARHRSQQRPYEFDHRGQRLRVSSLDIPGVGRIRAWRRVARLPCCEHGPSARGQLDLNAWGVLDRIADGVLVVDSGDRALWANKSFLDLYGLDMKDVLGKTFEEIYVRLWDGAPDSGTYLASLETLRENQRFSGAPFDLSLPGSRWVRVVEQRGDQVDGRGYFVHVDITAAKREQKALQQAQALASESEAKYRFLAEYSSDVTIAVADGILVYASPSVTRTLGWQPQEVLGRNVATFCHPEDARRVDIALQALKGAPESDYRARALRADGSYVWVESRARKSSQTTASGAPVIVLNVRSIAARKALEDELELAHRRLEELATTDGLTGLSNRRRFDEVLELECRRAQREGCPLSLVMLDIDHFKHLNDTHGHQAGDRVLRHVGRLLSDVANRAGDIAARIGGDEFALLLPNTTESMAVAMIEGVRLSVIALNATVFANAPVTVSAGVGCTENPSTDGTPADLLRLTDAALYAAKREGRNRVRAASHPAGAAA